MFEEKPGKYNRINDDKRKNLITMFNDSFCLKEAAKILGIKYQTAWSIIRAYKNTNLCTPKLKGGSTKTKLTPDVLSSIEDIVSENPEYTLKDIKNILEHTIPGLEISLVSIHNALKILMVTLKKTHRELERVNENKYIELRQAYAIWFNDTFKGTYFIFLIFQKWFTFFRNL